MKTSLRLFTVALVLATGASAHALESTSSPSFKINYSSVAGLSAATSASFQSRGANIGNDNLRVQSAQDLPVTLSTFTID